MLQASKTQFFACLLAPPAGWPCFRLSVGLGLTVGLAIGGAELMGGKFAVDFLDNLCRRNWLAFLGAEMQIMVSKCFLP